MGEGRKNEGTVVNVAFRRDQKKSLRKYEKRFRKT